MYQYRFVVPIQISCKQAEVFKWNVLLEFT